MNQYFIMDIPLKRGYTQHSPALKRMLNILYPDLSESELFEKEIECNEVNNSIDKYIKDKFGKTTADLCLDYFADMFGDGMIHTENTITFMQLITELVKHKDLIRKNIEQRCI